MTARKTATASPPRAPYGHAAWFDATCSRLATEAFRMLCADPSVPWFVYYVPNGLAIEIGWRSPGPGWRLATERRIPSDRTREQIGAWLRKVASTIPVLPK